MHKICLVLLAISINANDIRISEVMSNPQGSEYENEFIELFNASDHVIQINGWVLSDGNGEDSIAHFSGPREIQPGRYALILDPGFNYDTGPYLDFLNDSLSIYTITTDGSFGNGGLSNAGESVLIRSPDSSISSEMSWVTSTQNGFSWERISMTTDDAESIWEQSLTINGTPGLRNSVTMPLYNLALISVELQITEINEPVLATLRVNNRGEYAVSGFSVDVFRDDNQNGAKDGDEWEHHEVIELELASQDSLELPLQLFPLSPGIHQVKFRITTVDDEVQADDTWQMDIIGSYPQNIISITEVMYSPSSDQQGEWVEIQNQSGGVVSLQGWMMSDANATKHHITDSLLLLEPMEYLTLCASSNMANYFGLESTAVHELNSWPALNSTSDSVRLFDANGHAVAVVYYRGSWGESSVSLERRHPQCHPLEAINWKPSTNPDGGTPSAMNTRHLLPLEIRIAGLSVVVDQSTGPSQAEVSIEFQSLGADTLYMLELESDADIYWWGELPSFEYDTLTFTSSILWPGYNLIPINILHDGELLADTSVQVVLGYPPDQIAINEIHYYPHEDQTEFIEVINTGSSTINLRGWSYVDRSRARGEVINDFIIEPDSLALLTADANKLRDWAPSHAMISEMSSWPSLNNSSDSIIILDPLGRRMLAQAYENPPEGEIGKSLERLALWKPQDLASSWSICDDPQGITPGRQNSRLLPPNNLSIQGLNILDSILWVDDPFTSQISIVNRGYDFADGVLLSVSLFQDDAEIDFSSTQLGLIVAGDTLISEVVLSSRVQGRVRFQAEISSEADDIPTDNILFQELFISGGASPLVLNEVMSLPVVDQEEWLEFYNRSDRGVDLRGWLIADNSGSRILISDTSHIIMRNSYLVLGGKSGTVFWAPDVEYQGISNFPTLNNSEERITLYDPQGISTDEMSYGVSNELISGRSLERIRSFTPGNETGNWGICIADQGSTPGIRNSLYLDMLPSELEVQLNPNPFSPDGDGHSDHLAINYELPFEQGLMSIMIFDMAGRKIADPVQIKPVSHRGQVQWDGEANYGGKAVTGLYIMKFLIDDMQGHVYEKFEKIYLLR